MTNRPGVNVTGREPQLSTRPGLEGSELVTPFTATTCLRQVPSCPGLRCPGRADTTPMRPPLHPGQSEDRGSLRLGSSTGLGVSGLAGNSKQKGGRNPLVMDTMSTAGEVSGMRDKFKHFRLGGRHGFRWSSS